MVNQKKFKIKNNNKRQILCLLSGEQNSVKLSLIKARNSLSNLGLSKTGDNDLQTKNIQNIRAFIFKYLSNKDFIEYMKQLRINKKNVYNGR